MTEIITTNLIRVCCECNRTVKGDKWGNHPEHTAEAIEERGTHGFCPECEGMMLAKIALRRVVDNMRVVR